MNFWYFEIWYFELDPDMHVHDQHALDMARYRAENDQMCFLCFMSFCVFFKLKS